ncbi:MAG: histidine phosphatase family protein [Pedosphaera sp.]|nr:histidine phosphatase family protein [Pedosphaera sp.]
MLSPTRIVFIRHGEVESSYHRVFGGRIDMELSPFGHEQARVTAEYLRRHPFDAIYASPMRRVQQTLSALVALQDKLPTILPDLREVDFGEWTGLSWDQVKDRFQISAFTWLEQLEHGAIDQAESIEHFRSRVETAMWQVLREQSEKTVAVLCHGGVIRMALSILLDLPLNKTAAFEIEYASVTIVNWRPSKKSEIQLLNFTPWRDIR